MQFTPTNLPGVVVVDLAPHEDSRGMFARSFCRDEFERHGLDPSIVQCNISYNSRRGTLRGMHYQSEPFPEAKLVRVTCGEVYDVAVDLRPQSPAFRQWTGHTLSAANRKALYIPYGVAHGFQTLTDDAEVFYQMSEAYHADLARGVRWNDPAFGIVWPIPSPIMSDQDASRPDFVP
jgi:dTDP-4-dehydrorhamnose 3,5-epimerase